MQKKPNGTYEARIRIHSWEKITYKSLRTKDKEVARKRLNDLYRQMEREEEGLATPEKIKQAAQTSLSQHLRSYISDLEMTCTSSKHTQVCNNRINKLIRECGWKKLKDIDASSFREWRAGKKKTPKTLNDYQSALNSFLVWLKENGLMDENPIERVQKVPISGRHKFQHRHFTPEEFSRLLGVAGDRAPVYITAAFTGLRRGELEALQWGDLFLDVQSPYLVARASTTKNRKDAVLGLHRQVVRELRAIRPPNAKASQPVFDVPPIGQFKKDLEAAEIEYLDDRNRRADFHSLRHSFATWNALAGTPLQVTKQLMRHSDVKLTDGVYTHIQHLQTTEAINRLPTIEAPSIAPSKSDAAWPVESQTGEGEEAVICNETTGIRGFCPLVAQTGAEREWCSRWESKLRSHPMMTGLKVRPVHKKVHTLSGPLPINVHPAQAA